MKIEKGISTNLQDQTPGKLNEGTGDLRVWIGNFIDENKEQIKHDWQSLQPKDRVILFEKFLKYTLPSLQSIKNEISNNGKIAVRIIRVADE